jgi:ribonuclease P protein component
MISYSFNKAERLCSKTLINNLFSKGNRVISQFPFRILWQFIPYQPDQFPAQVMFSVSKRNFPNAVIRNRIKRQMRELYRKKKHILYPLLAQKQKRMVISITFQGKTIMPYNELNQAFEQAFQKILIQVEKTV